MPRFNRQGPQGEGPKTGRGMGRCNPDNSYEDQFVGKGQGLRRRCRQGQQGGGFGNRRG